MPKFLFLSGLEYSPFCSYQGEALKNRCGGVVLVGVGFATFLSFQIGAPNTHTHTHTPIHRPTHAFWEGAIFPHLHKPSWKVYSLIPGPLRYKRAEDLGLFSLQSLSLLIRETQTLEDNSRLGSVKERWRVRQITKEEWKCRENFRDRWKEREKLEG